jgi:serine/threonine protein kinase
VCVCVCVCVCERECVSASARVSMRFVCFCGIASLLSGTFLRSHPDRLEALKSVQVTELMSQSLQHLLAKEKTIGWESKLRFAHDAALGMAYLHEFNRVHRDLKSANLLVSSDLRVKVCVCVCARVSMCACMQI